MKITRKISTSGKYSKVVNLPREFLKSLGWRENQLLELELDEKYGEEAKAFLEENLLDKEVKLEYERGYEKDRFNRLNAYVFVGEENIKKLNLICGSKWQI